MADVASVGSAAPGHYGASAASGLTLREVAIAAAWNVQGDPARPEFVESARMLLGVTLPAAPNTTVRGEPWSALWLGPNSWLALAAFPPLDDTSPHPFVPARDALNAAGGALFDVSAARVGWTLSGPRAADVLAKGCPLDFHRRGFPIGGCAQSMFGHCNALFVRHADDAFTLLVARSFARDVWHMLCETSAQYGYDVLPPAPFPAIGDIATGSH
jgi:sarcosine oxidase subunit gamma